MDKDKELLILLQNAKTKHLAFNSLVNLYKEKLYWHIRHILKNHDDTDDVLQNTFIKIYNNIDKFKGESKLYSWMYRIATNEALTHIKKERKKLHLSIDEYNYQLISNLETDSYFDGDEIKLKLQKAISTLPEKQQLVFNMKYFQEMKYKDISEILDTSVGALKANYHHAVKKIEEFVKLH